MRPYIPDEVIYKWIGVPHRPFNRSKGFIMSCKYPIVVSWGRGELYSNCKNDQLLMCKRDPDGYRGSWKIQDEYFNDWNKYKNMVESYLSEVNDRDLMEDEEVCESFYYPMFMNFLGYEWWD